MKFEFQDISVEVTPTNDQRRWYMTVEDVAAAYGRARTTIMDHLREHSDEIRGGIEKGVGISDTLGGQWSRQAQRVQNNSQFHCVHMCTVDARIEKLENALAVRGDLDYIDASYAGKRLAAQRRMARARH